MLLREGTISDLTKGNLTGCGHSQRRLVPCAISDRTAPSIHHFLACFRFGKASSYDVQVQLAGHVDDHPVRDILIYPATCLQVLKTFRSIFCHFSLGLFPTPLSSKLLGLIFPPVFRVMGRRIRPCIGDYVVDAMDCMLRVEGSLHACAVAIDMFHCLSCQEQLRREISHNICRSL